jgi:hypothetical protein
MISQMRKVNKVDLSGGPTIKSHMTQNFLDLHANEGIDEGCWLGFKTWHFNSKKHECMRAKTP